MTIQQHPLIVIALLAARAVNICMAEPLRPNNGSTSNTEREDKGFRVVLYSLI